MSRETKVTELTGNVSRETKANELMSNVSRETNIKRLIYNVSRETKNNTNTRKSSYCRRYDGKIFSLILK